MKVKITQEDINYGRPRSPGYCPIALALNRTCGRKDATVALFNWSWDQDWDSGEKWSLPLIATYFIRAFDAGEPVEPMEVEL